MTPAVEAAKRAGVEFQLHEYEGVEVGDGDYAVAVAAAVGRPAEQLFKTLVASVGGRIEVFVVPADRPPDLRAVGKRTPLAAPPRAQRAAGHAVGGGRPLGRRRGARDRLRGRRDQPAGPASAPADDRRRVRARVGHDPRQRRQARVADRARAGRSGAADERDRRAGRGVTGRSAELRAVAERLVAKIPADVAPEVVVTGSVSRGVADDVSDVEMLLVTHEQLDLETCFALAAAAGVEQLDSWGPQGIETSRVSGYFEEIPFELIWWSREYADA